MSSVNHAFEVNFDGLVGPTHNFAGLSYGNIAASEHANQVSSPKLAALQGLKKMKALADMGLQQGVLLPHERPHIPTLKRLGFAGNTDADIIAQAIKQAPLLFKQVCSGSAMWVANAATVSPFADTADGLTHFTPANLSSMFHRRIESDVTSRMLQSIFASEDYVHHPALPHGQHFSDEGAANHTRLCSDYAERGVELFVYGERADRPAVAPQKFPARQTLAACEAVTRLHGLDEEHVVLAQQNPLAIDAGVFHNDVIAVGNTNVLFYHEYAFLETEVVLEQIRQKFSAQDLHFIEVKNEQVSLQDAVSTYLFNTQLVQVPGTQGTTIIAPTECQANPRVHQYLQSLSAEHPAIHAVHYFDVKQSMNNGGGPACLRLRVVMKESQIKQLGANVILTDHLYQQLCQWVNTHYREQIQPIDLHDPALLMETRTALDELTQICKVGSIYDFQR
ncbi:N-succinylarginine dihydrolase [Thalassocella blandensis]|nr:N-succinylarginine dihydrolase [Thalassocella blandensis]